MKKNFAVAMAIMAGLCFAGSGHLKPTFAGEWEEVPIPYQNAWGGGPEPGSPHYQEWVDERGQREDGTTSVGADDYWDGSLHHYEYSNSWDDFGNGDFGGAEGLGLWNEVYGGYLTISAVGKRRTKYHWNNIDMMTGLPDPNDTPPDFLTLKITGMANGSVSSDTSGQNRDTSKENVTVSLMGESGGIETSDSYGKATSIRQTKLYTIPTNGVTDVFGPWVDYDVTVQLDGNRVTGASSDEYIPGEANVEMSYSASVDDRSLYLTRPGAVGEIRIGTTTYGHSRFSNKLFDGLIFTNQNVTQQYIRHLNPNSTWGTDGEWNWSPVGDAETAIDSTQTNELGSMEKDIEGNWYGSPTTARVQTTTYTLKDPNDGAVGTATYELILHDEFEFKNENTVTLSIENVRAHPHTTPVRATTNNQSLTVGVTNGYSWTVGGSFGGNIQASKIIGLSLGVEVSRTASTDVNASVTINNVPIGWETYLEIYDRFDVRTGTAYQWSDAGYVGEANWSIKVPSQNPTYWGIQAKIPYDPYQ